MKIVVLSSMLFSNYISRYKASYSIQPHCPISSGINLGDFNVPKGVDDIARWFRNPCNPTKVLVIEDYTFDKWSYLTLKEKKKKSIWYTC